MCITDIIITVEIRKSLTVFEKNFQEEEIMTGKKATKLARVAIAPAVAAMLVPAVLLTTLQTNAFKTADAATYVSDYGSKNESIVAGAELNERIAEEGIVLLKNSNNTLPLKTKGVGTQSTRVTLFGYNSVYPEAGASVNDTDASAGVTIATSDFYSGLAKAGYKTNPAVRAAYTDWKSLADTNTSDYAMGNINPVKAKEYSFADYGDAAIVVLGRTGASSTNGGRTLAEGAGWEGDTTSHSRQIDKVQKQLLDYVLEQKNEGVFGNVIVIINDPIPLELGYINEKADAVLWIGAPGATGFNAVGKILSGEINPSGRLPDIYPVDMTKDPTYNNFGRNSLEPTETTAGGNQYTVGGQPVSAYFTDYEEGIYIGYRYYETMAVEVADENANWYNENVVYPFGAGQSYSDFSWEIEDVRTIQGSAITGNERVKVDVKVTNNGNYAGKDVVQLYYTAPYSETSNLEKSHVVLGDFAKTDVLAPGQSETVTLTLQLRDMASYDVTANSGKGAYVLEAGDYYIKLQTDSHNLKEGVEQLPALNLSEDIIITESDQTGKEIHNAFDYDFKGLGAKDDRAQHAGAGDFTELSRDAMKADGSHLPQLRTKKDLTQAQLDEWDVSVILAKDSDGDGISDYDEANPAYGGGAAPWYDADAEAETFADAATRPAQASVVLSDMIGASYNDPRWETLINQLTREEIVHMFEYGGFKSDAIPYIGKPETLDTDSPLGWSGNGTAGALYTRFATAPVIAATWNKELAYEMGKMIGDQGLWGRSDTGRSVKAYTGWYGPGMNTHRSPFLSRYEEYYSEDGLLAGMMAANATLGAAEKGCYVFIKHFALHEDGGTDRGIFMGAPGSKTSGLSIWCSEQAVREIYLKPFQLAVELGGAMGAMSSFSRFGTTWAGGSYGLLTQWLRNECGFDGLVNTDIAIYDFLNAKQMLRAGGDFCLDAAVYGMQLPAACVIGTEELDNTTIIGLKNAAHNILYTVANSNAMDVPHGAAVVYNDAYLEDVKVGEKISVNIATATLNTVYDYDATITYTLVGGILPEGLTLEDGYLEGTVNRAGEYTFVIEASSRNFASAQATIVLRVNEVEAVTPDYATKEDLDNMKTDIMNKLDEKKGGCSGSVETAIAIPAALAMFGIVFVVAKRSKAKK